jgi:hypothetical protein
MPNIHNLAFPLEKYGMKNADHTGNPTIFYPIDEPHGMIKVRRAGVHSSYEGFSRCVSARDVSCVLGSGTAFLNAAGCVRYLIAPCVFHLHCILQATVGRTPSKL